MILIQSRSTLATAIAIALLSQAASHVFAQDSESAAASNKHRASNPEQPERARKLGTVEVRGKQTTSLPTQIPTTMEGVDRRQIAETINASDSSDALKYFPSLNVRKRYIGDFDHAVLATRASGTGNSARSLVYADGIQLSNLLGNGASFTPRWGLVTPEEIERVDVLYGPFSAAYPGNSAGAVVDYVTRMPERFEASARVMATTQHFKLYQTNERFNTGQLAATLGSREGAFSWWLSLGRVDSKGQPLVFANRLVSAGVAPTNGVPVSGAVAENNPRNQPWLLFGATNQVDTVQDNAKVKLAYDLSPTIRAAYTLGVWRNEADRDSQYFLRDASGTPVFRGNVVVNNRQYALTASDLAPSTQSLEHVMHGLSVRSNSGGPFDWQFAGSLYDYAKDRSRAPTAFTDAQFNGASGRITDLVGTKWTTLSARAISRPTQWSHTLEGGLQQDRHQLRQNVFNVSEWTSGEPTSAAASRFGGNTQLTSIWLQDTWRIRDDVRAILGLRHETWRASNGLINTLTLGERRESAPSPKAALAWQFASNWSVKASVGRAHRFPTVSELYQGSVGATGVVANNDPNLKAERSWTGELSVEGMLANAQWRSTYFNERTQDALYSQTNTLVTPNVVNIQNVDHIQTHGVEVAIASKDALIRGVELSGSATWAQSIIEANAKFPASIGKWQPRVPRWRANLVATYHANETLSFTAAARYSGRQFNTIDNADPNGFAYTGTSSFFVADLRARWQFAADWSAALGVDNVNNKTYWAFHPYPQRTFVAELRWGKK